MYRPTKQKLVRRVSVASVVAVLSATGLGVAFIAQSGATTSAIGANKAATTKVATAKTTTKTASPLYHIVVRHHDDSRSSDDN